MGKMQTLNSYISRIDETIESGNTQKAHELQDEVVAVYENEIKDIYRLLDNYSHFQGGNINYIKDLRILKAKLINYKENLESGLYKEFLIGKPSINLTQTNEMKANIAINIELEEVIEIINHIPEDCLSVEDKDTLAGKLAQLEMLSKAKKDKKTVWDKAGSILKWVGDKSVQVGVAALPYIMKALENAPS